MWRDGRIWRASDHLPGVGDEVRVDVFAGLDGPTECQRTAYDEMVRRFDDLRTRMQGPLLAAYEEARSAARDEYANESASDSQFEKDYPAVSSPADIWRVASLVRVEVYARRRMDFCFNHRIAWADEDHGLNVVMKDFNVIDVAYEG